LVASYFFGTAFQMPIMRPSGSVKSVKNESRLGEAK
jgi:hypothetical protein